MNISKYRITKSIFHQIFLFHYQKLLTYMGLISSPPSAAYMRQWTGPAFIQVMDCRNFGAKPLPEPRLAYCHLHSWKKFQRHLNRNSEIFIEENAFEIVVCQNGGHFIQGEMS